MTHVYQSPCMLKNGKENKEVARETVMHKFSEMCHQYDEWIKTFIKHLTASNKGKWSDLDYYTTQAMIGHGFFGSYLHRIGKTEDDLC